MANWKYTEERETTSAADLFVRLNNKEPKKLKISDWEFLKGHHSNALFKCSVCEEDDVPVDKFWYVWDYELNEELKKKLKSKKIAKQVVLTITRKADEDEIEEEFIVKWD